MGARTIIGTHYGQHKDANDKIEFFAETSGERDARRGRL